MKHYEVEQKFRVFKPSQFRIQLRKMGAQLLHKGFEKNELWDDQDKMRRKSSVLRLREAGKQGLLTYKGPRLKSKFKKRVEVETVVNAAKMREIFQILGFKAAVRYEKYREEYYLKGAHVTLDHLKNFGWFAEIEGSVRTIEGLAKQLGFSAQDREERSYLEIIYGRRSLWAGK